MSRDLIDPEPPSGVVLYEEMPIYQSRVLQYRHAVAELCAIRKELEYLLRRGERARKLQSDVASRRAGLKLVQGGKP